MTEDRFRLPAIASMSSLRRGGRGLRIVDLKPRRQEIGVRSQNPGRYLASSGINKS
jgi:hypothetical protein